MQETVTQAIYSKPVSRIKTYLRSIKTSLRRRGIQANLPKGSCHNHADLSHLYRKLLPSAVNIARCRKILCTHNYIGASVRVLLLLSIMPITVFVFWPFLNMIILLTLSINLPYVFIHPTNCVSFLSELVQS